MGRQSLSAASPLIDSYLTKVSMHIALPLELEVRIKGKVESRRGRFFEGLEA